MKFFFLWFPVVLTCINGLTPSFNTQHSMFRTGIISDTSDLVAAGAKLQLVSSQFSFTEGPAANKAGDVYFTDQPNDKIWKYDTKGNLSLFMEKTGRSNGLYFDKKGNLISCADEKNELWSIKPNKKVTVLLKDHGGKHFNGPNDLWVHPGGQIYFTDPYYQRSYWKRKSPEIAGQKVYYLPKGSKKRSSLTTCFSSQMEL
ncbi:SMP-30/gluconolactonase/LRE family protein [Terrimonas alba]|uniref:SMP-30/gluconolactonase/LRE family protein n=1 Tax=Terrimonas alba TaxID=3349636 RepID=UPI0035F2EA19